jgi:hypothetical protein
MIPDSIPAGIAPARVVIAQFDEAGRALRFDSIKLGQDVNVQVLGDVGIFDGDSGELLEAHPVKR